ncbi:MAG TPA: TRZ/ATZ family hydrolase, partial [Gammaproteobacteria bacterium]|nr:TRZ/ATZ family hydrolase [Gammaproteobacteria bacterium]
MQPVDLLIHARWVVPVEPVGTILDNHALAVHQGKIVALLPSAQAEERFTASQVVHRSHHVLIPGLINAHTHTAMSLLRGLADDLPLRPWLEKHIWPAETQWMSPRFVQDGAELAIAEMLLSGTTCFNDMYFFPDAVAKTAVKSGIRASIGMIVINFPSAWAQDATEYLSRGMALRDDWQDENLLSFVFAPHAPYTVDDAALKQIKTFADELDVPVQIHLHETAQEVAKAFETSGQRPLDRLDKLGLLNNSLMAVHMTALEDHDIARLAETGASVVHCPESNLKLASGFCPVAKLAAAGVNLALGTDGAASNNDLDMLGEMHTAALLAKGVAGDAAALPAADVLEMATLGGARALGLSDSIGSLSVSKWADVTCVDLQAAATQPVYNPVSQLVYAASRDQVSDVWVAGQQQVREG